MSIPPADCPAPAKKKSAASSTSQPVVEGMGPIPLDQGVAFRVWAPNADAVSVTGPFNDWDAVAHPLTREDNGTWYGVVPEANVGDEYKYHLRNGEAEFDRVDPRARKVVNSAGNGIVWVPKAGVGRTDFKAPTQDQLVIYEMHIGTFHAEKGKGPGSFASAIEKIPYLVDLGINAIEIMPIAEFAGDLSWGYNPAHPFAVESAYGGPEALQEFVRVAHENGIAVILDVVYNHFGPSDLSLWQFDGWSENGGGGIYFYNDWRAETPWGATRPDYGRGEVRSYIRDNARMWIADYGIDGLRWDMSLYIRTYRGNTDDPSDDAKEGWGLCQWINDELRAEFPGVITLAEDLRDSEWVVKPTGAGGAGFGAQWDAGFVHPVRETLVVAADEHRDLDKVVGALKSCYDGDAFKRVVYSESHDEVANGKARLPSEINPAEPDGYPSRKRSSLGAALVMTAPGIPMIFQGQEFLEDEWFRDEVPVDWTKLERFPGMHAFYRDLISLRRNSGGFSSGLGGQYVETHHVNHESKVIGYHRKRDGGPGDDVIVIVNLSTQPVLDYAVGVPSGGLWRVRLNSDSRAYSDDFSDHPAHDIEAVEEPRDGFAHHITTGIGPYSVLIFSQDAQT
ncbi:alpha-amylase family glycosyl hydrolase [Rariglobus hedericola]|uniref:1,4-alpha-glucan branching enzyme n=1 Tax=Rariglobus hedericola TaxID=2597822 RepID=A0A556QL94_9BACT|nr:alpha-amylase family glycosyl hydrolase [Rariglobus hedericola]TSJ77413.1 1,4-alpha-glucan branching protein [Rariglobus hedericola]